MYANISDNNTKFRCRLWVTGKIPYPLYVYSIVLWIMDPTTMFAKARLE